MKNLSSDNVPVLAAYAVNDVGATLTGSGGPGSADPAVPSGRRACRWQGEPFTVAPRGVSVCSPHPVRTRERNSSPLLPKWLITTSPTWLVGFVAIYRDAEAASAISLISFLVMASAKVPKLTIWSMKAFGPPITFRR